MKTLPLTKGAADSTRFPEPYRSSKSATGTVSTSPSGRVKEIQVVRRGRSPVVVLPVPKKETLTVRPEQAPAPPAIPLTKPLPIHQGLVELALVDTVRQLRAMKSRFGTHSPSPENLVYAYACAAALRVDEDEWQLFCMAPEWRVRRKKPTIVGDDRTNALMHVMRFLHGIGHNMSLPVKQAMKTLRPYWVANVSPYDLHVALARDAVTKTSASLAVRFVDNGASRQLLGYQTGTSGQIQFTILQGKGRAKHLIEISAVHTEPL